VPFITIDHYEALCASVLRACDAGDRALSDAKDAEIEDALDRMIRQRPADWRKCVAAIDAADRLASHELAPLTARCVALAGEGRSVGLLVALRKATAAAQPVALAYGVADVNAAPRSILENVLRALATPRIVFFLPTYLATGNAAAIN
jgi:hypothetical protein